MWQNRHVPIAIRPHCHVADLHIDKYYFFLYNVYRTGGIHNERKINQNC